MKKLAGVLLLCFIAGLGYNQETKANTMFQSDIEPADNEEREREREREREKEKDNEHELYIDGQQQSYTGAPIFEKGVLYVTIQAAVQVMNEKAEIDSDVAYEDDSPFDFLEENDHIEEIDDQEVVRVSVLQELGIRAEWFDNPGRLHLETTNLLTVDNLQIGDSMEEVDDKLDVHWNTAFGQPADYVGFHGDMQEFTYTDRYGEERSGEVPDIQLEITEGELSYIILSSSNYETARGVSVGDSLFDVRSAHGSQYLEEKIDGKTVYIYHVRDGSLWFIANEEKEIERIGLWAYQLEGYER